MYMATCTHTLELPRLLEFGACVICYHPKHERRLYSYTERSVRHLGTRAGLQMPVICLRNDL